MSIKAAHTTVGAAIYEFMLRLRDASHEAIVSIHYCGSIIFGFFLSGLYKTIFFPITCTT